MKATVFGSLVLSLLATTALVYVAAAQPTPPPGYGADPSSCTAPVKPGADPEARKKTSSFAPQGRSHRRVYGAPIQHPLVSSHKKHKPRPVRPGR